MTRRHEARFIVLGYHAAGAAEEIRTSGPALTRAGVAASFSRACWRGSMPPTYSHRTGGQEDDMPDKSTQPRLDATKVSPDLYKAMLGLEKYVEASGLEQKLLDLVKIRASQI